MFTPVFYKKLAPIFAFMTLGLVAPMKMLAQVDTGAISGTVKDTSGGVIPGAKVTIINEQYELSPSQTVQAAYVGNGVRHLGVCINPNSPSQILPPGLNSFDFSPYPDFPTGFIYTSFAGNSYYPSLQLNYERPSSAGLQVLANFTWSKCRTDATDVLNETALSYRAPLLPGFGIQGDYGLCDFDIIKAFHLSGAYELPVGAGKRSLANSGKAVDAILGGWKTNKRTNARHR